jgi:hypothetical protein
MQVSAIEANQGLCPLNILTTEHLSLVAGEFRSAMSHSASVYLAPEFVELLLLLPDSTRLLLNRPRAIQSLRGERQHQAMGEDQTLAARQEYRRVHTDHSFRLARLQLM